MPENKRVLGSNLARLDSTTDEEIARQIAEDPDAGPELTDEQLDEADIYEGDRFVRHGRGGRPRGSGKKELVSLRLDRDLLDRFRAGGPGWQTRINDALRAAVREPEQAAAQLVEAAEALIETIKITLSSSRGKRASAQDVRAYLAQELLQFSAAAGGHLRGGRVVAVAGKELMAGARGAGKELMAGARGSTRKRSTASTRGKSAPAGKVHR